MANCSPQPLCTRTLLSEMSSAWHYQAVSLSPMGPRGSLLCSLSRGAHACRWVHTEAARKVAPGYLCWGVRFPWCQESKDQGGLEIQVLHHTPALSHTLCPWLYLGNVQAEWPASLWLLWLMHISKFCVLAGSLGGKLAEGFTWAAWFPVDDACIA